MSAARGYAKTKPIIIVKPSRTDENQNLTNSDTGQLKEAIHDAAFRRSGVVRVETINGLFDCAKTLSMQPSPNSPRLNHNNKRWRTSFDGFGPNKQARRKTCRNKRINSSSFEKHFTLLLWPNQSH